MVQGIPNSVDYLQFRQTFRSMWECKALGVLRDKEVPLLWSLHGPSSSLLFLTSHHL